ncbi:MAG TPA: FAD-dependent oxidoreductase [Candidatus Peribacterales bacterium]|nr:FAD-dependent oxidoreductase [Candidatus Peribacterales bacterium]
MPKNLSASGKEDVLVVGRGVSGLGVSNVLARRGHRVTNWFDRPTNETTSSKAAAFWYPYLSAPQEKVREWSESTFHYLKELAVSAPEAGVRMMQTRELFSKGKREDPFWKDIVPDFRHATSGELPPGFEDAYLLSVPMIHTRYYLKWLLNQNIRLSVKMQMKKINHIDEAFEHHNIVVNCTGLGSRDIQGIQDNTMTAIRGQLVCIKNPGDIKGIMMDEDKAITYLCTRPTPDGKNDDVVLGGTVDHGNESLTPDPKVAQEIIERCSEHYPSIRKAKILGHTVGLRPGRPAIRVEAESKPNGKLLVHNYGHGGSGFTVIRCADDVVKMIEGKS